MPDPDCGTLLSDGLPGAETAADQPAGSDRAGSDGTGCCSDHRTTHGSPHGTADTAASGACRRGLCQGDRLYSTENNFTGQRIYEFTDAYLRYGTVKKLAKVSEDLAELGLYLKIWDGFRPVSAQFRLWEICPDPTYVANPTTGYSSHSRGNTVDLTLVDESGMELAMPPGCDDFSAKADRHYAYCSEAAANNAQILEILMEKHGFTGYFGEWWHFSDTDSYPVEEVFEPA